MSGSTERSFTQLTRDAKKQARMMLDTGNNRLWLILAILIWIATAGAIFSLGGSLVYVADESIMTDQPSGFAMAMTLAAYGLMLLLALLLLVPMSGGVMQLSLRIYQGKPVEGRDLFCAFSSFDRYVQCMKLGAYTWAKPILVLLVMLLAGVVAPSLAHERMIGDGAISVLADLIALVMMALGLGLGVLMLYLCRNAFLRRVLMTWGYPAAMARERVRRLCRNDWGRTLGYRASFAGWAALAVVTVGASAVIDTLPYLLLCDQFVCDALISQKNQNGKLINKP